MRPAYETNQDLKNQEKAIEALRKAWHCSTRPLPPKSPFDYAVVKSDGSIPGFVEVKCRKCKYGQYPDIMLSWHKLREACAVGRTVVLLVQWNDCLGWVELTDDLWETLEWGGRTAKTRDAWDEEPIIKIKNEKFKIIC